MSDLSIKAIIDSKEFKESLKKAIESGKGTSWAYDEVEQDEYEVDIFDVDPAVDSVLELLTKTLL